jgi:hypothetical protein
LSWTVTFSRTPPVADARILVVGGEEPIRYSLVQLLERAGYECDRRGRLLTPAGGPSWIPNRWTDPSATSRRARPADAHGRNWRAMPVAYDAMRDGRKESACSGS